jgi:subtilase family serine protease
MKTNAPKILSLTIAACLLFLAPSAPAAPLQTLSGHVPAVVAQLQPTGLLPATNRLHLAVGLAPRNRDALAKLLEDLQDPQSPGYHQYLSLEEFTKRFGPSEGDYQKAMDFAQANGLKVTGRHPNRIILDVEGAAADVEKALHVTLRTYQHPTEKREFYAPDTEPALDLAVPLLNITGLDNYHLPHHVTNRKPVQATAHGAKPKAASGPYGYAPADLRNAYVPGTTLTGAGQNVGLLELGEGHFNSDLTAYESEFGLPPVSVTTVPVDGGFVTQVGSTTECSLDIEMVMAMAPGASIYVFEGPAQGSYNDLLSAMATYTNINIRQFSSSAAGGVIAPNQAGETLLMEMAAQGQSFFAASGDHPAINPAPWPCSDPYLTSVGGTELTMNGSGASYASETVWEFGFGAGSAGGSDSTYASPTWQQGVSMTANGGSHKYRDYPDVAMAADNIDTRYDDGVEAAESGTSAAAPLWAGFMALVNQQAASLGKPSAGFINPAIYAIGEGAVLTPYAFAFHDITTGSNGPYSAVAGYDLCTGWGTPRPGLINVLAGDGVPSYYSVVLNTNDSGPGSLRQAISNAATGAYQFNNSGYVTFSNSLAGATILLTSGALIITNNLTIDASALPGGITINGNQAGSVFVVTNGNVVLTALTITNGMAANGGGISNTASLTVNQCTLVGNSATDWGGGIENYGTLVVNESTLTGNSCGSDGGGGVDNERGLVTLNQSTLSGNNAPSGTGGIYSLGQRGGSITIVNSILSGNTSPSPPNLQAGTSVIIQSGVNLTNGTPLLAPLGNYGDPTPTSPPLPGSPAIDGCTNGTTFTTDQRGYPRIVGIYADIGAVEGVYNSAGPGQLKNVTKLGNGSVSFTLTNYSDMSLTVLASTSLALPFSQWSNLGAVVESPIGSGQYPFTDPQATNSSRRFYTVKSP